MLSVVELMHCRTLPYNECCCVTREPSHLYVHVRCTCKGLNLTHLICVRLTFYVIMIM